MNYTQRKFLFLLFFTFHSQLNFAQTQLKQDSLISNKKIANIIQENNELKNIIKLEKQHKVERTMYAFLFFSVILLILFLLFFRILVYRKKINQALEAKIQERTQYLEKVISKLAYANQELDTFLYRASHDLKGPIVTMEGLCNVALMEEDRAEVDEFLKLQKQILDRMKLMLFRIIEIGQIRGHKPKPTTVNMKSYCKKMIRSMGRINGYKQTLFYVDVADNFTIQADLELLDIAMDNIIRNAIEHNKNDYAEHYVKIRGLEKEDFWEIAVIDNGLGIPETAIDKVFGLFFRNTDRTQGFGLGLYKAKTAIEKMKGSITAQISSGERETMFLMYLPKKDNEKNGYELL